MKCFKIQAGAPLTPITGVFETRLKFIKFGLWNNKSKLDSRKQVFSLFSYCLPKNVFIFLNSANKTLKQFCSMQTYLILGEKLFSKQGGPGGMILQENIRFCEAVLSHGSLNLEI